MIKAAVLLLGLVPATASAADAWSFAKARCLLPLEDVRAADTAGLTAVAVPDSLSQGHTSAFRPEGGGWPMLLQDGQIDIELAACAVIAAPGDASLDEGHAAWRAEVLASGRYSALSGPDAPAIESFEWREPRIRITLTRPAEGHGSVLRVWEVPLEA